MAITKEAMFREIQTAYYAHRGLHANGIPENSMTAFRQAVDHGFGAELDVHLTADGQLVVFHDNTLTRMTGQDGRVCEMTAAQLQAIRLSGSNEPIPLFEEVLAVFEGTAPLIIELKAEKGNHAALCEAVCRALEGYSGVYCIESFDPRCLLWLKTHRPDIVRGQLAQNFMRTKDVSPVLRLLLSSLKLNALTKPDFVAYRFEHRNDRVFRNWRAKSRTPLVYWTLRTHAEVNEAVADGAIPIFEGIVPKEKK